LARNEDGEFELVLGNRQLISVFLIVVILLAVLFSMGYIVGRNSTPVVADATRPNTEKPAKPIVVERATDSPAPVKQDSPAVSEPPKPKPAAAGPAAKNPEKPAPAAAATPAPMKETKPQALTPSAPASATSEPPPGQYWQVVATSRPDAEIISEALGKKGFHSIVAPGPRDTIFRVLVGPFKDAATTAQGRADLEASGFKNPIMRKY
jgi:cell division septation protein DedD